MVFRPEASPKTSQKLNPIAKVSSTFGEVKIRRATSSVWRRLVEGSTLYVGDRLFVAAKSSAKVSYLNERAIMTLPEWTIIELSETPPALDRLVRGVQPAGRPGELKSFKTDNTVKSELSLNRSTFNLISLSPRRDVYLSLSTFPQFFEIKLKKPKKSQVGRLYGELWMISPVKAPVWSGTGRDDNDECECVIFDVPFSKEGEFTFVAANAESTNATEVMLVRVASNRGLASRKSQILPSGLKPGDLMVIR